MKIILLWFGGPEFLDFHHTLKLLCTTHIGIVGPKVIGSIPEGEQKTHKYTCFARSAMCIGDYDLYPLMKLLCQLYLRRWQTCGRKILARPPPPPTGPRVNPRMMLPRKPNWVWGVRLCLCHWLDDISCPFYHRIRNTVDEVELLSVFVFQPVRVQPMGEGESGVVWTFWGKYSGKMCSTLERVLLEIVCHKLL